MVWPSSNFQEGARTPATLHHAQVLCRDGAVRDARARFCDACLPAHYDPLDVWPAQTKAHHCPNKSVDAACASKHLSDEANRVALLIGLYQKMTVSTFAHSRYAQSR